MCNRLLVQFFLIISVSCCFLSLGLTESLPDPTRPPSAKAYSTQSNSKRVNSWSLTSTLIANNRQNATINGQLVSLGQTVNGAKVISIRPNEVWLLRNKKYFGSHCLAEKLRKLLNQPINSTYYILR